MVRILPVELADVQVHPGLRRERPQELAQQAQLEIEDLFLLVRHREHEVGPAAQVQRHAGKRFIHRHEAETVALDALAVAQRLVQRLAQREADILHRVVVVHRQVARRLQLQIE